MKAVCFEATKPHLIAALVTPFTSAGDIDRESLHRLVRHLQENGVDEYFVVGSTGESPLLDESDRLAIIETARRAAPDGVVYAGVSGMGHRHALRNARDAASAGADFAVVMSPYFLRLDQMQMVSFCTTIADASPLPVILYHHLRMPTPLDAATVAKLAGHPNIVALKDTSGGEHDRCAEILAATAGRPFKFFQGVEKLVLSTLRAGGQGCVVAQACLAPRLFRSLLRAHEAGEAARAEEIQVKIDALWTIFSHHEVRRSFSHFLHTLKLPLQQRGILRSTAGAVPGVVFDPEFERMIMDFMRTHLETPALHNA